MNRIGILLKSDREFTQEFYQKIIAQGCQDDLVMDLPFHTLHELDWRVNAGHSAKIKTEYKNQRGERIVLNFEDFKTVKFIGVNVQGVQ